MIAYLWVAIGSGLGGMARFWCVNMLTPVLGDEFPLGTLIVNITGSFIIGFLAAFTTFSDRWDIDPNLRHFAMAGLCGGYTTFSAFSLQTLELIRNGEFLSAGFNSLLSVTLCLLAVWVGYMAASFLARII